MSDIHQSTTIKRRVGSKNRLTLPEPFSQGDLIQLEMSEDFVKGKSVNFTGKILYKES